MPKGIRQAGRLSGHSPKWRQEIPSACGPNASGFRGYHAKRRLGARLWHLPSFPVPSSGPCIQVRGERPPRMNSTQPITTTWQTNSQVCQRTTLQFRRRCRDLDRRCRVILVVRLSQHRFNLVRLQSIPSKSALIRRPKQHAPARYSPTPLPVHHPVRRRPTRRLQAERLQPTTHLLRMVRIANLRSLTPRSIEEPPVLTDWRSLLRLSWSRLGP